jgi:hypothetical protein
MNKLSKLQTKQEDLIENLREKLKLDFSSDSKLEFLTPMKINNTLTPKSEEIPPDFRLVHKSGDYFLQRCNNGEWETIPTIFED